MVGQFGWFELFMVNILVFVFMVIGVRMAANEIKGEKLKNYGYPKISRWRVITIPLSVLFMFMGAILLGRPIRIFLIGSDSRFVTLLIFMGLLFGQFAVSFFIANKQIKAMQIDKNKK